MMWARDRGAKPPVSRWHVEIDLDVRDRPAEHVFDDRLDTHFHFGIYAEEWGYRFCHEGRASWIRVTDVPFAHGRDDFRLLEHTLSLATVGALLRRLEQTNEIAFRRDLAAIRTDLKGAEPRIRQWLSRL